MADWVFASSALVLLVLLLRAVLKKHLDPRLRYALWLLVLLRLLCPLPLFESALNLPALAERALEQAAPAVPGPAAAEDPGLPPLPPAVSQAAEASAAPAGQPAEHRGPECGLLLPVLWGAGAAGLLALAVWDSRRFGAALRRGARPLPGQWTAPPKRIYISSAPGTPCLFGLFAPAIYVSEALTVNDRALGHALSHERAHYRHGDSLWAALRLLALALHWYNPLVWLACLLSRQDAEAAADASAIAALGEKERLDYGETLLTLAVGPGRPQPLSTTMRASKRRLRARLRQILHRPRTAIPALLLALVCAALAFRLAYAGPVREQAAEVLPGPVDPPAPVTALPAEPAAGNGPAAARGPLVRVFYGGQIYVLSFTDSVTYGPLCCAQEEFGLLTAPDGEALRADLEVSDPALAGLTLRRYSSAAVPHGFCVEQDGELLVFKAYDDLNDRERRRAEILSSEEAFTEWLRQDQDGTPLSPEAYAGTYDLPLVSLRSPDLQSLGQVWVRQDPAGGTDWFSAAQVFYSYPLGTAVLVYQGNGRPYSSENFYGTRTNDMGQPFLETHSWAWFSAGITPVTETGSLRLLLFSAAPLDESLCRQLLAVAP